MNAIGTQLRDPIDLGLGTGPIAYGSKNKWTPPRKWGGVPLVITTLSFGLSKENGRAVAGRDNRTFLTRPNYQTARTGAGKLCSFSLFS